MNPLSFRNDEFSIFDKEEKIDKVKTSSFLCELNSCQLYLANNNSNYDFALIRLSKKQPPTIIFDSQTQKTEKKLSEINVQDGDLLIIGNNESIWPKNKLIEMIQAIVKRKSHNRVPADVIVKELCNALKPTLSKNTGAFLVVSWITKAI